MSEVMDSNMDFEDFFPSRWLTPADVPHPITVEIINTTLELMQDGTKKCALHFPDGLKPMLQNKTNFAEVATIAGTTKPASWLGTTVEIYATTTTYRGKVIPCLRIRRPRPDSDVVPVPDEPAPRLPLQAR